MTKKKLYFQHIYINLMRLGVCAFKGQHSSFDILTKQQNVVKSLEWIHLHSQVGSPPLEWEIIIYKGTSRKRVFIFWVPTYICLFYMKFYFTLMDEWGLSFPRGLSRWSHPEPGQNAAGGPSFLWPSVSTTPDFNQSLPPHTHNHTIISCTSASYLIVLCSSDLHLYERCYFALVYMVLLISI